MSKSRVRLPEDWKRYDRVGLFGSMLFPLALILLWLTGFGPSAYKACLAVPTQLSFKADAATVTLAGHVANVADKALLVDAARQVYGAGAVVDNLKIEDGAPVLGWGGKSEALMRHLKSVVPPSSLKIVGSEAVIEGSVPSTAAKETAVRDVTALLGTGVALKDGLVVTAPAAEPKPEPKPEPKTQPEAVVVAPLPKPAPPPAPVPRIETQIVKGQLGVYRLPNGSEISIVGEGLEAKVLAFLNDPSKLVEKGLWFDFDRLHFKTGSAELTPESRVQIETLVAILKAYPSVAVKVGGYTDNVGDPGINKKLSGTRAERVAEALVKLGITADRIEAEGYGEEYPIASNETAEGRARNRRTALSVRRK